MSNVNTSVFHDASAGRYDALARDYANSWRSHTPDPEHHRRVREAYLRWDYDLGKTRVGAIAIFGPGFSITNRDFSPESPEGLLEQFDAVLGVDWSTDVLSDFLTCIERQSSRVAHKTYVTQRDMSGGISPKFHQLIDSKLDQIVRVDDLRSFFRWLGNEVGVDEVNAVNLHEISIQRPNQFAHALHIDDPTNFETVLGQCIEVRRAFASMLLAGMLAKTEDEVRKSLLQFKDELNESEVQSMLQALHRVVTDLHHPISVNFIQGILSQYPDSQLFMPTDIDAVYDNIGSFPRLDVAKLKDALAKIGMQLSVSKQWTMDDSHECPPHSHTIQVLKAHKVPNDER